MGYCIELEKSTISVTKENAIKMMDMLADYITNHKVDWRWINEKYLTNLCKEHNFEEVTEELRYPMYEEDGIYKIDYFSGEKPSYTNEYTGIFKDYNIIFIFF